MAEEPATNPFRRKQRILAKHEILECAIGVIPRMAIDLFGVGFLGMLRGSNSKCNATVVV